MLCCAAKRKKKKIRVRLLTLDQRGRQDLAVRGRGGSRSEVCWGWAGVFLAFVLGQRSGERSGVNAPVRGLTHESSSRKIIL